MIDKQIGLQVATTALANSRSTMHNSSQVDVLIQVNIQSIVSNKIDCDSGRLYGAPVFIIIIKGFSFCFFHIQTTNHFLSFYRLYTYVCVALFVPNNHHYHCNNHSSTKIKLLHICNILSLYFLLVVNLKLLTALHLCTFGFLSSVCIYVCPSTTNLFSIHSTSFEKGSILYAHFHNNYSIQVIQSYIKPYNPSYLRITSKVK